MRENEQKTSSHPPPQVEELYQKVFEQIAQQQAQVNASRPPRRRDTRSTKVLRAVKEWKNVPLTLGALGLIIGIVTQMYGIGAKVAENAKEQVIERLAQHNTNATAHHVVLEPWQAQCSQAYQRTLELQSSVRELQKALADLREQYSRRRRR